MIEKKTRMLLYYLIVKVIMTKNKNKIDLGLLIDLESLKANVLKPYAKKHDGSGPTIEVVSPSEVRDYPQGVYHGTRSDVLVCSEHFFSTGINRIYLHVGEGGIADDDRLAEILVTSREREIMLIGEGSTEPKCQRLRALSAQYFVPVLIMEDKFTTSLCLPAIVERAISGKSHEEIVRELGAKQYM